MEGTGETDSVAEETGFEPSVPRRVATLSREPYPPLLHFPFRRKERAVRLACLNPDSSAEGAGFELPVPLAKENLLLLSSRTT